MVPSRAASGRSSKQGSNIAPKGLNSSGRRLEKQMSLISSHSSSRDNAKHSMKRSSKMNSVGHNDSDHEKDVKIIEELLDDQE